MSETDREFLSRYVHDHADDAFAAIVRRYVDLVYSTALRQVGSPQLAEEVAQSAFIDLARLMEERGDAVKQLLTPEEARQYDLRMSSTARQLANQLESFEPSIGVFDALFDLQKAVDDEFPDTFGISNAQESARKAETVAELREQIREELGPERFADYQMAQDFTYRQIYRVARQAGLGISAAREIYSLRQQAERQMAEIRLAPNLAPDEQTHLLEAVRLESAQSIEALIGAAGRAQLEQARNDRWLEILLSLPIQSGAAPP